MRSDTDSDEVHRFDWIRSSAIQEAGCLTFVRGNDILRVAKAFGAVVEHAQALDFDEFCEEAFAHQDRHPVIGLRRLDGWVLVVEDNGGEGAREEVLRRVAQRAEAVSVFWDACGCSRFTHAVGGEIWTSFEAVLPDYRGGVHPDALEEIRAGLPWCAEDTDRAALMLALSARITDRALLPETFDGTFVTYPVAAWPDDLPTSPAAVWDGTDEYPPQLLTALRRADRQAHRRVAVAVARRVLEHADCLRHPVLGPLATAVLSQADLPARDREAVTEIVRSWAWRLARRPATSVVRARAHAAEVLRQATNPDPLTGAFAVLAAARRVRGVDLDELTVVVMDALRHSERTTPSHRQRTAQ